LESSNTSTHTVLDDELPCGATTLNEYQRMQLRAGSIYESLVSDGYTTESMRTILEMLGHLCYKEEEQYKKAE